MSLAAIIAKGVAGGAGGGFMGAVNGMGTAQVGNQDTNHLNKFAKLGYDIGNQGLDELFKSERGKKWKDSLGKDKESPSVEGGESSVSGDVGAETASAGGAEAASAGMEAGAAAGGAEAGAAAAATSDYNLKEIYGDSVTDKIIENFAKISAIDFTYKPEAQEQYQGSNGVDGNEHVGVIAQELEKNPVTEGTVAEDQNGNKVVDTRHLAFADTAAIAELSRRVLALEAVVKEMAEKIK